MKIDFSAYLDLTSPPQVNVVRIDRSKFKKNKTGNVKFDYGIGAIGEYSSVTEVITKETKFNPNDYVINGCDLDLYCAAMLGGPLY